MLADFQKGVQGLFLKKGTLRFLAARCNMCLRRCSYDVGVADQLPRLRTDIAAYAEDNTCHQTNCTEPFAALSTVREHAFAATEAQPSFYDYAADMNETIPSRSTSIHVDCHSFNNSDDWLLFHPLLIFAAATKTVF